MRLLVLQTQDSAPGAVFKKLTQRCKRSPNLARPNVPQRLQELLCVNTQDLCALHLLDVVFLLLLLLCVIQLVTRDDAVVVFPLLKREHEMSPSSPEKVPLEAASTGDLPPCPQGPRSAGLPVSAPS